MTEKDEKGAGAPPAITPRKHVPRPSVTKAKTTGPVPAPPAGTKSDAASTSGKSSADKGKEAKGGTTTPAAKASPAPASRPVPAADVTAPAKPATPAATPASPAVAEPIPAPTSSGTSSSAAAASPPAAATPGRTASPVSPVVDADTGAAPAAQSPDETAAAPAGTPRKVRLSLSRVDPWSVMKLSFLLSVAGGIMLIVASWVFWYAINDMGIFTQIDEMVRDIVGAESTLDILQYVERDKVLSIATLIAVIDVVLLTALGTIGAFLYNVTAALVGGLHVTLTDE